VNFCSVVLTFDLIGCQVIKKKKSVYCFVYNVHVGLVYIGFKQFFIPASCAYSYLVGIPHTVIKVN
jgi:hypothetical protein